MSGLEPTEEIRRDEWVEEPTPPPPAPPPAPPPRAWWPWLLALLVLVLGGLAALIVFQRTGDDERTASTPTATTGPGTVTLTDEAPAASPVPDVVGASLPDALEQLQQAGLVGNPRGVFSERPKGIVVSQSPEPGADAERGAQVRLNVSKGAQRVDVPDVVGLARAEAETVLRDAGFEPRPFQVPATDPAGTVVAQSPPGGARAAEGDAVRINVSMGEAAPTPTPSPSPSSPRPPATQVTVPDVVGLPIRRASRQLRDQGLVVHVLYVPSTEPANTVVAQRPVGGTTARRGAGVRLNVSQGPDATDLVVIPDVVGLTDEEAIAELEAAGFQVEVVPEPTPDQNEQSIVLRQEPESGSEAPAGALIAIYVGEYSG